VIAAVSFFMAPAVAFYGIRSAAEADDLSALSDLIDYDQVRASIRPQLSQAPQALTPPPSFLRDPIGNMRQRFQGAVAAPPAPDVDAYLSSDALAALTYGEGRNAVRYTGPTAPEPTIPNLLSTLPRPAYWGVNRTRFVIRGQQGSRTVFSFTRRGPFEWKLAHIGLPPATVEATANPDDLAYRP